MKSEKSYDDINQETNRFKRKGKEKEMKKKVLASMLCVSMTATMLAGCGGKGSNESTGSGGADGGGEGLTEIIWQYPTTIDTTSEGFVNMENALNEMMERDIGVHVVFEPVNLMESQNDAILKVSAGEKLDIMLSAFTSIGNLVTKGLIIPLDELLEEHGQDIIENSHTLDLCGYQGETYGVCTGDTIGQEYGYLIKKEYWDKYNLAEETGWTEDKIYTTDELGHIFEIVKAGEGDNFYCDVPWNTTQEPMNNGYTAYDKISGSLAGGVLMMKDGEFETTVSNLFETEEYEEYCKMRYEWAKKGYISPDAATTTEMSDTIVAQKNYLGVCYWAGPNSVSTYSKTIGTDLVCLKMVPRYMPYGGGSPIQWSIPNTCENPEKAIEALNYIYKNPEAAWLIEFGLEGEEYEVVEEQGDLKQIRWLADDIQSLPYYMPYGIWGNTIDWPVIEPNPIDENANKAKWDDAVPEERISPAMGYSFVEEAVTTEMAAVNTVIEQYTPSLNCGALDPKKALPEFISALKAAGMDTVLEEQQKQFDEWLASQD